MVEKFKADDAQLKTRPKPEAYEAGPSENLMATMAVQMHAQLRDHDRAIATHDGLIKGMQSAVSAVQSSLAAKIATIGAIAALLAGLSWFNLNRTSSVGDDVRDQNSRMAGVETRVGAMENGLTAVNDRLALLPQQVAAELRRPAPEPAPKRR